MAGPLVKDRVKETTTTTGTGTYTLAGAATGFQSFSVVGNANTCFYCCENGTDWEVGIGTYTSAGTTLARTTILYSSNAGSAVNWGAGTKNIFVANVSEYTNPLIKASSTTHAIKVANETVLSSTLGNARGIAAVDLQTKRLLSSQVASNNYASIGGGRDNTASGLYSVVSGGAYNISSGGTSVGCGGYGNTSSGSRSISGGNTNTASASSSVSFGSNNTASGTYSSVPGGLQASANKYGQRAMASGRFSSNGDAQTSEFILRNTTTNNTQTEIFLNGSSSRMTIASDTTWAFSILIVARRTDADNESAAYLIQGCIDNNAGTTALVGTITTTILAEDTAAWGVTAEADNTNDALVIKVTGETSKTIRWVAFVRTVEVTG